MKKLLYLSVAVFLLLIAFLAGSWFNQLSANRSDTGTGERQILHYVDPMNPANISAEPGIAPCGMPMEPVYADEETSRTGAMGSVVVGTVRVNSAKQQLVGVQVDAVTRSIKSHGIRSLGRVIPDENRTYTLYAATDGWMGQVHDSTTGSLVRKDQLMAQIRVYDYDFFTWQQRYLTEMGNASMRPVYVSPPSRSGQMNMSAGRAVPSSSKAGEQVVYKDPSSMELPGSAPKPSKVIGIPPGADHYGDEAPGMPHDQHSAGQGMGLPQVNETAEMAMEEKQPEAHDHGVAAHTPAMADSPAIPEAKAQPMAAINDRLGFIREDDILYATKGRLELLDLGVGETQLAELARRGVYVTRIDLRAPVNGIVLSRNVFPSQRIERGVECFRIADIDKVWVDVDLYEPEREFVVPGQSALVSLPGKEKYYKARVSEVPPRYDAATRTLKVRLEIDNPEYLLRPDMFVDVQFMIDLPNSINIPASAIVDSGLTKTVYVASGEGVYEPREVQTGWRFADRVEIVDGLREGEKIAVSGTFLIDSESRMKLAAAGLMSSGSAATPAQPRDTVSPGQPAVADDRAVDPVCTMKVDKAEAEAAGLTVEHNGQIFHFCSEDCKEQFSRNPGGYLEMPTGGAAGGDAAAEHMGHSPMSGAMTVPPADSHQEQMAPTEHGPSGEVNPGQPAMADDRAVDPFCGMKVDKAEAEAAGLTVEYNGQIFHFCSEDCKEQFSRNPGEYTETPAAGAVSGGVEAEHAGHSHD